jgi:hypothetical protein
MRISLTFVILTKFLASDNSFNKEQPMLNKKIFMKIAQPYAAITLAVKNLHSFVRIVHSFVR